LDQEDINKSYQIPLNYIEKEISIQKAGKNDFIFGKYMKTIVYESVDEMQKYFYYALIERLSKFKWKENLSR
jgi:hypothetical protein